MTDIFNKDSMDLVNKIDELIEYFSVEIVNLNKKHLTKKNKNKEVIEKQLRRKKEIYHNLSLVMKDLEEIGRLSYGTENEISRIPRIIETAKFMVKNIF